MAKRILVLLVSIGLVVSLIALIATSIIPIRSAANPADECIPESPDPAELQDEWNFVIEYYKAHTQSGAGPLPTGPLTNIYLTFTGQAVSGAGSCAWYAEETRKIVAEAVNQWSAAHGGRNYLDYARIQWPGGIHHFVGVWEKGKNWKWNAKGLDPWPTQTPVVYSGVPYIAGESIWESYDVPCAEAPAPKPEKPAGGDKPDDSFDVSDTVLRQQGDLFALIRMAVKKNLSVGYKLQECVNIFEQYGPDYDYANVTFPEITLEEFHTLTQAPDVAILTEGYFREPSNLVCSFGEPVRTLNLEDFSPTEIAELHPVLIIPSGGLYGLDSSPSFKTKLEQYVANGGTVVVFSQQHGSDYAALPGGELRGYGWLEDQSCQYASVGISTYHVILSGQSSTTPSINVDGYFTKLPENATILLSRTKNGMPAMLMYQYGEGWVIVSSIYDDWAYGHYAATGDGMKLIKDTISWAKQPAAIPDYAPGSQVDLSIEVTNSANSTAHSAVFYMIAPDSSIAAEIEVNLTPPLAPGESRVINFTYTPSALGIWFVDYSLNGSGVIQSSYEVARFAVSRYAANPNGFTYQGAEITFTITTPGEDFAYGSDVPFTINVYNHGDTNRTISFSAYYKDWSLSTKLPEQNIAGNLTVPAGGEDSFAASVHVGDIYLSHNQLIIYASFSEDGASLGYTRRAVNVFHPTITVNVATDKQAYAPGGNVSLLLTLQNQRDAAYNVTKEIRVLDPENTCVFEQSIDITLNASATENETVVFSLPTTVYGDYLVTVEAYVAGNRAGSGSTYFELPKDYIVDVTFDHANNAYKARDSMTMVLNVTNLGAALWSSMVNTSIPDLGFEQSADFSLDPGQSGSVSYHLTIPGNITVGKHYVTITIQVDNSTQEYYFFIPQSSLTLGIDRTNYNAGENVTINLSNSGGVNTTYNYSVMLCDSHRTAIYEGSPDDSIQAGETKTLEFTIPEQAVTGNYRLEARCNDLSTGKATLLSKPLTISGLSGSLEVFTDKEVYLANDTVNASTRITNTGEAVENGTLSLKVYSGRYQVAPEVTTDSSLSTRLSIYNDFIGAVMQISGANAGRFTANTTGGDPEITSDNNKKLIYGHPNPATSFTTVRIDGYDYQYGSGEGVFVSAPHFEDSSMVSSWEVDGIVVTERLTIVYSATGNPDALRIGYYVENEGGTAKDVGIRVMIDTQLAANDGAPFVIPDVGDVTKEMEFIGADVPVWWTTMDDLADPNVIAHGTLRGVGSDPDRFVIAHWGDITGTTWDYTVDPNQLITGDSAIGIWWNPVSVSPGGSTEVATFYGIGYVSAVGGVAIWEHEEPLTLAEGAGIDIATIISGLNVTGKLTLVSTLSSATSQTIARDVTYFYIAVGDVYLTLKTDKTIYQPNEEIRISGNVTNARNVTWTYNLTIKANAEEIYSQSFNLTAGESRPFNTTTAQNASFVLEGTVNGVTITDFIRVEYPSVNVLILAPDVAGLAPFDVGILIENIGNVDVNINVTMGNESWNVTIPAGESRLIESTINITQNTTLEVVVSGDISKTVQKEIVFGESATINMTPQSYHFEGNVEIPFTVENTGLLDTEFEATFSISSPEEQTITRDFYLPVGESITDTLSFTLSRGTHLLRYSSPFGQGEVEIYVGWAEFVVTLPPNLNLTAGQETTWVFTVRNIGGVEGEAQFHLMLPDFDETNSTQIRAGEEAEISFSFTVPDDLGNGTYEAIYELNGVRGEFTFSVQGARISVAAILDEHFYAEGETANLTLNITNECALELNLFSRVKLGDYDAVQNFTLPVSGSHSLEFNIPVHFNGDKIFYSVYTSSGRALYINSLYIYEAPPEEANITLYTDKQVYNCGENVTIYVVANGTGTLNVTAPGFTWGGAVTQNTTLNFTLPELMSGTYSIDYTFDGYSSSYPFDVIGYSARIVEFNLDKESYLPGETVHMEAIVEASRDFSGVFRVWVFDPLGDLVDQFEIARDFSQGRNVIETERVFSTGISGMHVIVYGVYTDLAGHSVVLLASGGEYFDGVVPQAQLVVNITSPVAPVTYSSCQNFTLTVNVTNAGEANATDVKIEVSFNNTYVELQAGQVAEHVIGSINGSETKQESWGLHCNGSGATSISVNITAGNDTNTGEPILAQNIENDTITVNQQSKAQLVVNITSPVAPVTYSTSQNFTLTVNVTNAGEANATGVKVEVSFNNTYVELQADQVAEHVIGSINGSEIKQESWGLHCNGSGATSISVNITAGNDTNTGEPILAQNIENDTITVNQQSKAQLVVNITSPVAPVTYSTCQNFTLTVDVTNAGEANATDVKVEVSFNNSYVELQAGQVGEHIIGSINGSETKQESWELHCNGSGITLISVNITAGNDTNTGEPILAQNIENATITVNQQSKAQLVVNITSPVAPVTYSTCQNFTLTVNVTNAGEAGATGVKVEVSFNNTYVELQAGQVAEHVIGSINGSETKQESWGLHCNGSGITSISVKVTAGNDTNTGEPILAQDIENDTITVNQQSEARLVVNITSPVDGTDFNACQNFTVNVTVTNTGDADAADVYVTINVTGPATPNGMLTNATAWLIPGGENITVIWELHCLDRGDVIINATANGTDVNTGEPIPDANIAHDSVTVHQAAPGGLSGAAIAGIVVAAIAGAVFILFAARKRIRKR